MGIWPGLGVNYKAAQANWDGDIAYFKALGIRYIRPQMPATPLPWDAATNALWRTCAQYFTDAGFWVTWGPTHNGQLTAANWQAYHDAIVAEASYLQVQHYTIAEFEIGNELENAVDGTTLTSATIRPLIRQLAADVKLVYSGAISYAMGIGDGTNYPGWNIEGKGVLDTISLHPYGQASQRGTFVEYNVYAPQIQAFATAFGGSGYISEFNVEGNSTNFANLSTEALVQGMGYLLRTIQAAGIQKALVFEWCGYLNLDNQFAMKNTDGSFSPAWDVLLTNNKRRTFTP